MLSNVYNNKIRPVAISLIRRKDEILVYKIIDPIKEIEYYRLIGGCIEFNEFAEEAIKREFLEETSLELINIKHIQTFESIFEYNGREMHEIIFLFESCFLNDKSYKNELIKGIEGERSFEAMWINKNDLSKLVIFYTHASQKDGGYGAYYVRLRKNFKWHKNWIKR